MLRRFTFLGVLAAVAMAVSLFGVLGRGGGTAEALGGASITAVANGSVIPPNTAAGLSCGVNNGNFRISQNGLGPSFPCGDGTDEYTNWTFDFRGTGCCTPQYAKYVDFLACLAIQPDQYDVTSARLTLVMNSPSGDTSTDGIAMLAKTGPNPAPGVSSALPVLGENALIQNTIWPAAPTTVTLTHDWVTSLGEPVPSNNATKIRDNFLGSDTALTQNGGPVPTPTGTIAMQYQDDAVISHAELTLTCGAPVGGLVDVLTSTDGSAGNTLPISAALAVAVVVIAAGGWSTRKRWLP